MKKLVVFVFALLAISCSDNDNDRVFVDLLQGTKINDIYIDGDIDVKIEQAASNFNKVRVLADSRDLYSVECKMVDHQLRITLVRDAIGSSPVSVVVTAASLESLVIKNACNAVVAADFSSSSVNLEVSSASTLRVDGSLLSNGGLTANVDNSSSLNLAKNTQVFNSSSFTADSGASIIIADFFTSTPATFTASGKSKIEVSGHSLCPDYNSVNIDGSSSFNALGILFKSIDVSLSGASTADIYVGQNLKVLVNSASLLRYKGSNVNIVESDVSGGSRVEKI